MNVGEFVSDQFDGSYPVCPDPLASKWVELKDFMAVAKTVQEWNRLRMFAKDAYPAELINRLDASGFVVSLNLKNENHEN